VTSQSHRPPTLLLVHLLRLQLGQSGLGALVNPIPSIFPAFLAELDCCFYPAFQSPLGLDGFPLTAHLPVGHPELQVLPVGFCDGHCQLVWVHLPVGLLFAVCWVVIDSLLGEASHYSQLLIIIGFANLAL
jgi:hypothetical protein